FSLLDLAFFELDVLLRNRIVLTEGKLLGLVARVLLGRVAEAGIGSRVEADLDRCGLRHRPTTTMSAGRTNRVGQDTSVARNNRGDAQGAAHPGGPLLANGGKVKAAQSLPVHLAAVGFDGAASLLRFEPLLLADSI